MAIDMLLSPGETAAAAALSAGRSDVIVGLSLREPSSHIVISTGERPPSATAPRSIERAFVVLEAFTVRDRHWRTTDLARRCELPVPTVHRILRTLERFGYVDRDPRTRAYRLGPAAASLARSTLPMTRLRTLALPTLRALRSVAHETALLSAVSESRHRAIEIGLAGGGAAGGGDCARIGPGPLRERVGPLYAGASFKVLLAHMGSGEIEAVIGEGLKPVGPGTVTEPGRLGAELAAIRRRGWAFSRQETTAGRWAIAVPVTDPSGRATCALGIGAPLRRFDRERARRHLSLLDRAARRLARQLPSGTPSGVDRGEVAA
jgi:DNA-binding IclR family transcriptional regulator